MKSSIIIIAAISLSMSGYAQISISGVPNIGGLKKNKEQKKTEEKASTDRKEESGKAKTESASSKYTADEKAKILQLGNTDQYYDDCKVLEKIDAIYNTNFEFGVVAYSIGDAVKQMDSLASNRNKVAAINKKYADFWVVFKETEGREETKQFYYHRAVKGMDAFENRIKTGYTDVQAKISDYLSKARTNAEQVFLSKVIVDNQSNHDYYNEKVESNHWQAYFFLSILKFQKGITDPEYRSLWSKYESDVKELGDKRKMVENTIKMEKIASVECPKELYAGADKEVLKKNLRAYWTKNYPQDKIMKIVIIDKNWDRQSGQDWDNNYNRFVKFDNSWLMVNVIVEDDEDSALGYIYEASIQKNHMKNNEISYDYFTKALGIGKGSILRSKVK